MKNFIITHISIYCIIVFILSFPFISKAEEQGKIEGKVIHLSESIPVEFASVSLYSQKDNVFITGSTTDSQGEFILRSITHGSYYLLISYVGFKPVKKEDIILSVKTLSYNTGNIYLEEAVHEMKEVVIQGERMKALTEIDKTTYFMNDAIIKVSSSGADVLKNIPGVQVDMFKNITLEGSGNIIFKVDGKQRDKNYVNQLNPNQIDKIEIINNPGTEYDADISGVINIILKQERRLGVNGNIYLELPTSPKEIYLFPWYSFDFGFNKLQFFTSYSGTYKKLKVYSEETREAINENETTVIEGLSKQMLKDNYHTFHYGFDYFVNKKNSLNFYANYNTFGQDPKGFSVKKIYNNSILQNAFTTQASGIDKNHSSFYSIFYRHAFDNQQKFFSAEVNYYQFRGNNYYEFLDTYYSGGLETNFNHVIDRVQKFTPERKSFNVKIDYALPLNDHLTLKTGLQNYVQLINNQSFTDKEEVTENFDYAEYRPAAYTTLSFQLSKLGVQLGTRAEKSLIYIDEVRTNEFIEFLPSVNLNLPLKNDKNLRFSYRRSLTRPDANSLNPLVRYIDSLNISYGNPDLKPFINNNFKISYSKSFNGNYISADAYYNNAKDIFQNNTAVNEHNVAETITDNVGKGYEIGIQYSLSIKPTKWLMVNSYFRLFQINTFPGKNGASYQIPERHHLSYQSSTSVNTLFKNDISASVGYVHNGPWIDLQTTYWHAHYYMFYVEKQFKKIKIGFNTYIPFSPDAIYSGNKIEGYNFLSEINNHVKTSGFMTVIKLNYTFNIGKEVKKIDRNRELEKENKKGGF